MYRLTGQVSATQDVPPITLGCAPTAVICDIALSYLETTVTWDRRDNALDPRNGYYASLSVQGGGGPLFGDFAYVRLLPDLRYYRTFGVEQRFTLAGKVRLGTLRPYRSKFEDANGAQSSIVTRFFSGGGSSMRGFNSQRLAPQALVDTRKEPGDPPRYITVAVGGNSLFETSLEARYRVTESIVVATSGTPATSAAIPNRPIATTLSATGPTMPWEWACRTLRWWDRFEWTLHGG